MAWSKYFSNSAPVKIRGCVRLAKPGSTPGFLAMLCLRCFFFFEFRDWDSWLFGRLFVYIKLTYGAWPEALLLHKSNRHEGVQGTEDSFRGWLGLARSYDDNDVDVPFVPTGERAKRGFFQTYD